MKVHFPDIARAIKSVPYGCYVLVSEHHVEVFDRCDSKAERIIQFNVGKETKTHERDIAEEIATHPYEKLLKLRARLKKEGWNL